MVWLHGAEDDERSGVGARREHDDELMSGSAPNENANDFREQSVCDDDAEFELIKFLVCERDDATVCGG